MPITAEQKVTNNSLIGSASYDTDSWVPTANRLVIVAVTSTQTGASMVAPTLSGNGITYVQFATIVVTQIGLTTRLTLFHGMSASPSTGAITISFSDDPEICQWSVSEFSGVDTSGTSGSGAVVQSVAEQTSGAHTELVVDLATFESTNNATYGAFVNFSSTTIDPGSGFTELGETGTSSGTTSLQAEFKDTNDQTVDATWVISSFIYLGIGVEIKAAPTPGYTQILLSQVLT